MTGGFLRRDVGGGAGQARQAGDLQHRPGLAVHGRRVTGLLIKNGIAISMDGKGAWRDNVFVERLWRSVKYEEVYLRAYDSVAEARTSIGRYLDFYSRRRPHSSLDRRTPDQAYFSPLLIHGLETVRRWVKHFGPPLFWHLDEVFIKIDGQLVYLWRAVNAEGKSSVFSCAELCENCSKKCALCQTRL